MRILLAEDEAALRHALTVLLQRNCYTVDAVDNGRDALEYLRTGEYACAVLDVRMPRLDGFSVVRQLTDMTNALVTLAKADETEVVARKETVDLSQLTRQVLDSFKGLGREVDAQIPPNLTCNGDFRELRQLLLVLLDNSFRYCPGEGSIRLRLEQTVEQLLLTVENTAPGLTGDARQYIGRFYRGENAAGTAGSGLGLSIAEAIVRHHKGKLTIRMANEVFSVTVGLRK